MPSFRDAKSQAQHAVKGKLNINAARHTDEHRSLVTVQEIRLLLDRVT